MSPSVMDEAGLFEAPRLDRHPGPPDRQHYREKFVGQWHLVGADPMPRHQKPARQALLQGMTGVAGGGSGNLEMKAFQVPPEVATTGSLTASG